jgi:hypothetical protein
MLDVQQKYAVPRGTIQGLQDRASRFASMVAAFCERLGWYDMEALITKFQVGLNPCSALLKLHSILLWGDDEG